MCFYLYFCVFTVAAFPFEGVHLSRDNREQCVSVSPEEWVTVWASVAIHLLTLMERSEWNMADVVIAALHQRKERFLTLMLQSCLADSNALKTNNRTGQIASGKRRGKRQVGRREERRGGECWIAPILSFSFSTTILHFSLCPTCFVCDYFLCYNPTFTICNVCIE